MKFSASDRGTLRFIGTFLGLYVAWMMLYEWVLHPWGNFDRLIINDASSWAVFLLDAMGFPTFVGNSPTIRTIGIDGTHGLWIGDPCNGITLFALFTFFIIAYPGQWLHKLWFIPVGITVIHFMNVVRITALCIIVLKHPDWLDFNHTYTFQLLMYAVVFGLWYIWIRRFSKTKAKPAAAV
jgi:exosortase family protein XrtF